MLNKVTLTVALLAGFVAAQNNTTYIDPNSVDSATRCKHALQPLRQTKWSC